MKYRLRSSRLNDRSSLRLGRLLHPRILATVLLLAGNAIWVAETSGQTEKAPFPPETNREAPNIAKVPTSFYGEPVAPLAPVSMMVAPHKDFTTTGLVLNKPALGRITSLKGTLGFVPKVQGKYTMESFSLALAKIPATYGVKASELRLERISTDLEGNSHAHFAEIKNGRKVVGARTTARLDRAGLLVAIERSAKNAEAPSAQEINPKISAAEATAIALKSAKAQEKLSAVGEPSLVYVVSTRTQTEHLAYEVSVRGRTEKGPLNDHIYVDAMDGAVVDRHALLLNVGSHVSIFDAQNSDASGLPGRSVQVNGLPQAGDPDVNLNFNCLDKVRNFYAAKFHRDSLDNHGAALVSSVHFEDHLGNAYWMSDRSQMVFGDGDGVIVRLAQSLDVAAHELTHGVTASSSGLVSANEPGALNEAISDIMATACKVWDNGGTIGPETWLFGNSIMASGPGTALRYLDDPQKDHMSFDYYPALQAELTDNPGSSRIDPHYECGIVNLAFKLMVTGGVHPRGLTTVNVPAIGLDAATVVFYEANESYLAPGSTIQDARDATIKAAKSLGVLAHGNFSIAVAAAWDAVGVPTGSELP